MRENVVEITCDICLHVADHDTFQLDGKDACIPCVQIIERAASFGLIDKIIEAANLRWPVSIGSHYTEAKLVKDIAEIAFNEA